MSSTELIEAALAVRIRDVLKQTVPKLGLRSTSGIAVGGKPVKVGDFIVFQQGRVNSVVVLMASVGGFLLGPNVRNCSVIYLPEDQLKLRVHVPTHTVDGQKYPLEVVKRTPPATYTTQLLKDLFLRLKSDSMVRSMLTPPSDRLRLFTGTSNPTYTWNKKAVEALKDARSDYYNKGEAPFTDAEYDYLEGLLTELNPSSPLLKQIGAPVEKGRVHKLPVFMGSLRKVKNGDETVRKWARERAKPNDTVILSDKMDGASVLLSYKNQQLVKALSRGDGTLAQDITAHMRLVGVPETIPVNGAVQVRGEIIMPVATFKKKYADDSANPRAMIAGRINRIKPDKALRDAKFLAHGLHTAKPMLALDALKALKRMGFQVVDYTTMKASELGDGPLSKRMLAQRKISPFEMDGLVLQISSQRAADEETKDSNPNFTISFKDNTNTFTATVGTVEWDISRHGMFKPVLILDPPVKFGGVTIRRITAHNAGYVYQEGLGPGAIIEATRSGDVIPYVVGVIKKVKPQMPKGKWVWNDTHVDILVQNRETETQIVKANAHFFQKLGVDGLSEGITSKLYKSSITSVPDILDLSIADLMKVDGIQKRLAEKLYAAIRKRLQKVDLPLLAAASGCFDRGIGETRLRVIWNEYGNDMFGWKGWKPSAIAEEIANLPNTGPQVARQFAEGVPKFLRFWKAVSKHVVLSKPEDAAASLLSTALQGQSFCFSGLRDAELEKVITTNGGKVASGVAKGLTMLIAKDPSASSSKIQKANSLSIKVVNTMQFLKYVKSQGAK